MRAGAERQLDPTSIRRRRKTAIRDRTAAGFLIRADPRLRFLLTFVGVTAVAGIAACGQLTTPGRERVSYSTFDQYLDAGKIKTAEVSDNEIVATLKDGKIITTTRVAPDIAARLEQHGVDVNGVLGMSGGWGAALLWMPFLLLFPLFFLLPYLRGGGSTMGPVAAMTKSKARVFAETGIKTTFADVAGIEESKEQPRARRWGSAGRPLAGGAIRIAEPHEQGIGEIELRGPSITGGYLDNQEVNRAAFTSDGWFRTGDNGFVDRDGFLFVTGRLKEVLVLGGGKKVNPEDVERVYGDIPEVTELALLEDKGALVALVRPDAAKLRARGVIDLRDGIRVLLGEKAQSLPSYQRLSGFALTDQPLPRTRLGKYRRFLLPALYQRALAGGARRAAAGATDAEKVANALHERVAELGKTAANAANWSGRTR